MTTSNAPGRKTGTRNRAKLLTDKEVTNLKAGKWLSDPAPRGAGQLQVRGLATGQVFYFTYTNASGAQERLRIGADLSLADARNHAAALSRRYQSGDKNLREAIESEQREDERKVASAKAAQEALAGASLGALLTAYGAMLDRDGKASARLVKGALIRHVQAVWPELWATPAVEVTTDDLLAVIARVADQTGRSGKHKLREAAKLRSYLRAAYSAAIRARQSARGLQALRDLKISHNPAADLVTVEGAGAPRERALSIAELRSYWSRICALPGAPGAALRFHVLSGGQRVRQLARLVVTDYDEDSQTVRLLDPKGRRKTARVHTVPVIDEARDALNGMRGDNPAGDFLFSLSGGLTAISYESLRDHVVAVRDEMEKAGELPGGKFTVGDLRRTIETVLAGEKISAEVRAQLQSHGLGGVQARHYDRHRYLDEKRAALETLYRVLTCQAAKVTSISKRKAAK